MFGSERRRLTICLAQVETLLKGVNEAAVSAKDVPIVNASKQATVELEQDELHPFPAVGTVRTASEDLSPEAQLPYIGPDINQPGSMGPDATDWQLMGLGMSEAPPPWDVIEELYVSLSPRFFALFPGC
jgi:hypothetical protein